MDLQKKSLPLKEVLESYSHIELTEDETTEALIWRKQKKEKELDQKRLDDIAAQNRKKLTSTKWDYKQTKAFMEWRATQIFDKPFKIDDNNKMIFELLCRYFSQDVEFEAMGNAAEQDFDLGKGILLCGNYGTGKTWMMKLFGKNQYQCFAIRNAKQVASEYETNGEEAMEGYLKLIENASNDAAVFYQSHLGLCIDDLGTESVRVNYGNRKNVVGDLIERRYASGWVGRWFHCTTNLTANAIKEFYGERVASRLREMFNIIELNGEDRRK